MSIRVILVMPFVVLIMANAIIVITVVIGIIATLVANSIIVLTILTITLYCFLQACRPEMLGTHTAQHGRFDTIAPTLNPKP